MRVLLLSRSVLSTGGVERYLQTVKLSLEALGHKASVFSTKGGSAEKPTNTTSTIHSLENDWLKKWSIWFGEESTIYIGALTKAIHEAAEQTHCEAIWVRSLPEAAAALNIAEMAKIPVLYIIPSVAPAIADIKRISSADLRRKAYWLFRRHRMFKLEERVVKRVTQVVTLSAMRCHEVATKYKLPSEDIAVVPPGVDLKRFNKYQSNLDALRKSLMIGTNRVILVVSRLAAEKSVHLSLRIFARLMERHSTVVLIIVGDGPERSNLTRLAEELRINDRIRWVGSRSDVERFYAIADIFLHTSLYEGFGHVFLEAMASEIPCVAYAPSSPVVMTASDEIVVDGVTGYLVNYADENGMVAALSQILEDDALRSTLGREGRQRAKRCFDWAAATSRLVELSHDR